LGEGDQVHLGAVEGVDREDGLGFAAGFERGYHQHEREADQSHRAASGQAAVVVFAHGNEDQVGQGNIQPDQSGGDHDAFGQDGVAPGAGLAAHQAGGLLVEAEGDAKGGVDQEVDPQDLGGRERLTGGQVDEGGAQEGENERHQLEQDEADVLVEV